MLTLDERLNANPVNVESYVVRFDPDYHLWFIEMMVDGVSMGTRTNWDKDRAIRYADSWAEMRGVPVVVERKPRAKHIRTVALASSKEHADYHIQRSSYRTSTLIGYICENEGLVIMGTLSDVEGDQIRFHLESVDDGFVFDVESYQYFKLTGDIALHLSFLYGEACDALTHWETNTRAGRAYVRRTFG